MKFKYTFLPIMILSVLVISSCSSVDLSLVNQVKRFEPEWMNLSETVSFIDRNLRITHQRYEVDFEEIKPFISDPNSNERNSLFGLRSEYMNMVKERDELQDSFDSQKKEFVDIVEDFNVWQNKLMKKKLDQDKAKGELGDFQQKHKELETEINKIQEELIRNIESHNSLLRRITSALKLYTNYDINYR